MKYSVEHHRNILLKLCRICGQRAQTTKERKSKTKRPPKLVQSQSKRIKLFYGIDVTEFDASRHPDKICSICYRRVILFKNSRKSEVKNQPMFSGKALETDLLWKPHDAECRTCELYNFQKLGVGRITFLGFLDRKQMKGKIDSWSNEIYTLLQKKCTLISSSSPSDPGSLTLTRNHVEFCQIKMTRGRGRWPRDLAWLAWFSCARHSEKSVSYHSHP